MTELQREINKRRTFAIISHPDAGKTTLTEKLLLYGGAINQAGSVKGKKIRQTRGFGLDGDRKTERNLGYVICASVPLQGFLHKYSGHAGTSGLLGGHLPNADGCRFRDNGYRRVEGVENQTRKLFKVCVMRNIPIFTFINKMDRESRNPSIFLNR